MKVLEVKAVLRIFVPDNTTQEQANEIAAHAFSDASAVVNEGVIDLPVKSHIAVGSRELAKKIISTDLWVMEDQTTAKLIEA